MSAIAPYLTLPPGIPRQWKGKPLRFIWTYHAENGEVLGYVARFEGTEDKEVIPFFGRNGNKWIAAAPPEPRSLYGLDTLMSLNRGAVYVVEGEKCAAALHSLGWPAVSAQGGAQAAGKGNWKPLQSFERVYILPDTDEPGEAYACGVCTALQALPVPPEVFIARLPGLSQGEDVADWLKARLPEWDGFERVPREPGDGLAEELREALEACAELVPTATAPEIAPEAWEPPMPLDAAQCPPWPADVFPEPVQAFVDALAESTETPSELPALMVMAVLSTCAQGRYRVRVKPDYFEPLSLWTCCALPSGNRKSAVCSAATAPLAEWQRLEWERLEPEYKRLQSNRKTDEARIAYLRGKAAKAKREDLEAIAHEIEEMEAALPEPLGPPQVWCDDVTPEALATLMAENGERMALFSSEGGIFDTIAGRYSNGIPNLDVFLKAHAGDHVRVNRRNAPPIFLNMPTLAVGLAPQPDVIRELKNKPGFHGRGLLARFLYAMPKSNLGHRTGRGTPLSPTLRQDYGAILRTLLEHPWDVDNEGRPCAHTLILSPSAFEAWERFLCVTEAGMAEGGTFCHMTDWAGKLPGAVARIAAVLHVIRHAHRKPWEHPISIEDMGAALRMAAALEKHALITFDCMGADTALDDARVLLSWIRREGKETFTHRDAHASNKHRFPRAEGLKAPLKVLIERGYIREPLRPLTRERGRPSVVYTVNPSVLRNR